MIISDIDFFDKVPNSEFQKVRGPFSNSFKFRRGTANHGPAFPSRDYCRPINTPSYLVCEEGVSGGWDRRYG